MTQAIYLDYNATAPLRPAARAAVEAALTIAGNPSSIHRSGREARRLIETARTAVAELAGAAPDGVIFTSGATEANVTALVGSRCGRLLTSSLEHVSVLEAVAGQRVPSRGDGTIDLEALERMLTADRRPALISVMAVNNETGVIQPVAEVSALARRYGALVHCDAVQAAGRLPVDMKTWGVDLLSLSAHKLGGPPGVGALVVRDGVKVTPLIRGGGQERRHRGGTENLPGIAGFGAAAAEALADLADQPRLAKLRDEVEAGALALCPDTRIFGATAPRVANTTCLAMPGVAAETQVIGLDLAGVAVSAGAACSSGKVTSSHVLAAMGVEPELAASAIRVSLGWATGTGDIEGFLKAWDAIRRRAGRDRDAA
ncbi:MAG: cysteine desulfurase family protein [Inquilinaceae bacterium]